MYGSDVAVPATSVPQSENIGAIVADLREVASNLLINNVAISSGVAGSQSQGQSVNGKAPSSNSLADALKEIRYILREACGESNRARAALGL
jgi:hypothetical protein